MVSRNFIIAVKLAKKPAWKIAYEAGIHPNVLSKVMSGAVITRDGDDRVIRVGKVLGLSADECFDNGGE